MAVLIENKILFLHIPRTGGEWFISAIKNAGVNFEIVGNKHDNIFVNKDLYFLLENKNIKTITFIRHPAEWYKAYWELKNKANGLMGSWNLFETNAIWHPTWKIDNECYAKNFNDFIEKCIENLPSFVSYLYDFYTTTPPVKNVDYIIFTSEIEDQIPNIFKENNILFNLDNFINSKSINTFKNKKNLYTKNNLNKILDSERRCINKFNFTKEINNLSYLIQ